MDNPSMKWYRFFKNFQLFAAFWGVISVLFTAFLIWGRGYIIENAALLTEEEILTFGALKVLSIELFVLFLITTIAHIVTYTSLNRFLGITMYCVYGQAGLIPAAWLLQLLFYRQFAGKVLGESDDIYSVTSLSHTLVGWLTVFLIVGAIVIAGILALNILYFRKRAHLFGPLPDEEPEYAVQNG